jgi:aromatic ring-opening dioxygenase catalytic subunit (LigB family)
MEWPAAMGGPETWKNMAAWLSRLPELVGARPEAIVVISGHREEPEFTVNCGAHPPLFFDYYGFPDYTYKLEYPAPGAPA